MKPICTSPSFAKYSAQPVNDLPVQGFELIALPADTPLSTLESHLAFISAKPAGGVVGGPAMTCLPANAPPLRLTGAVG